MGGKSGKHEVGASGVSTHSMLTEEESEFLVKLYRSIEKHDSTRQQDGHGKDGVKVVWKHSAEEDILKMYSDYLHQNSGNELSFQTFSDFFCNFTKVPFNDRAGFLFSVLKSTEANISYQTILTYVEMLITSYMKCLEETNDSTLKQWMGFVGKSKACHERYAKFLCQNLQDKNVEKEFEKWFTSCSQFNRLQSAYIYNLFRVPSPQVLYRHQMCYKHLLPSLFGTEKIQQKGSYTILSITDVLFLNSVLPDSSQFEWELCFSTVLHGLGFGKLVRLISNKGPTLVIIKDKGGHVFGGYSSRSWNVGPTFHGSDESFLLKLYPYMTVYESTGYNNHYQYLNLQQQTMPNGLGMGGQFEYFGFWLDSDFTTGHSSESCTTYKDYKMLSSTKNFSIEHVEVWAVTNPEKEDDEDEMSNDTSILDKDTGAKALLEIAGKSMASEGYRDVPNEPL